MYDKIHHTKKKKKKRLALILKLSAILLDWPKSLFGVFSISLFPDIMIFPCTKLLWLVHVLKIRSVWFISCAKLKNPKWTFGQLDVLLAFLPFPPNYRWSFSGNWERSFIPYMGWCGVEGRVYLRCWESKCPSKKSPLGHFRHTCLPSTPPCPHPCSYLQEFGEKIR